MNMSSNRARRTLGGALLLGTIFLAASQAAAHPGHEELPSLPAGLLHPLTGLDHLLAMVAVGLWAAQLGGRAIWQLPAAFVGTMILGAVWSLQGLPVILVEPGILGSILVLGLLIACAVRATLPVSLGIVGLFALFHGAAHGAEMPANASGLAYIAGFALATAALHGAGLTLGLGVRQLSEGRWLRYVGAAIAATGLLTLAA